MYSVKRFGFINLTSVFKDYIWGGTKLNSKCNKNSGFDKTAESWELSVHPDGESIIYGGEYDGFFFIYSESAMPSYSPP